MGVGTTALPYEAMRREVTVTTNIAQPPNPGNQENPLVLGNSLSPPIVDEEVWNNLFSKFLVDVVSNKISLTLYLFALLVYLGILTWIF